MNKKRIKLPKHIGIIACSYEGAALCYKTICEEAYNVLGEHHHPEISMHTPAFERYMEFIYNDDWHGVADLMNDSARKLISIGAEILICPDNTIHRVYDQAAKGIQVNWLHIAKVVSQEAMNKGVKKLGILGTKYLMESKVYPEQLKIHNIDYLIPDAFQRKLINDIIFNELTQGVINNETKKILLDIIKEFALKGCDAIVLGCTELPLIIQQKDSNLIILDSIRLLAKAALEISIQ